MRWTDDGFAESRLKEFGVQYEVCEVSLSEIDFEESKVNNARLMDPILDDLIQEYALSLERGDAFPRPLLQRRKGKKYLILSGNHRLGAAKLKDSKAKIPCYVIETSDQMLVDMIPRVLNRGHGKKQEKEEAIEHAIHMQRTYKFSSAEVEKMFGLRPQTISQELRIREIRMKLEKNGISVAKMKKASFAALAPIKNDNVLFAASRLISEKQLPTQVVWDFLGDVKKERTEGGQMTVVAEYSGRTFKNVGKDGNKGTPKTNRHKFLISLGYMEKCLNGHKNLSQLQITEKEEAKRVKEKIRALVKRLSAVAGIRYSNA